MIGFITGTLTIVTLCILALIISSRRTCTIIDNLSTEYQKMLEQGLVPKRSRRYGPL